MKANIIFFKYWQNNQSMKLSNFSNIALLLLGIVFSVNIAAQTQGVLVSNAPEGDRVQLKWFTETIFTEEPVNIYRREEGQNDWLQINNVPVDRLDTIPGVYLNPELVKIEAKKPNFNVKNLGVNVDLLAGQQIVKTTSFKDLTSGNMSMIQVIMLAFQYNEFAQFLGIFYEDFNAEKGKIYEYKVVLIQENGEQREIGISASILVGDYLPSAPPKASVAKPAEEAVNFTWLPETNRYYAVNLYRDTLANNPNKPKVNEVPILISMETNDEGSFIFPEYFYQDDSLRGGQVYYYELAAIDLFGRESSKTTELKVQAIDGTPPPPVKDLKGERKAAKSVLLEWKRARSRDLVGYRIYRSEEAGYEAVSDLLPTTQTSFLDQTIPKWGDAVYYIASVDAAGNEGISDVVSVPIPDNVAPPIPINVKAVAESGKITLTWDFENPENDLMGFKVFRTIGGDDAKDFKPITPKSLTTNTFIDVLPDAAKNNFYYYVVALDTLYNTSIRSEGTHAAMPDIYPPTAPFLKSLVKTDLSINLEWLPALDADVLGYELFRNEGIDSSNFQKIHPEILTVEIHHFEDVNIKKGKNYQYRVRALDEDGNASEYSNIYTISTLRDKKAGNSTNKLSLNYSKKHQQITVKWKPIKDANLKGSMVYRKADNGRYLPVSPMLPDAEIYKDQPVLKGKKYTYQIRSFYENGSVSKSKEEELEVR
ncbi:MAG: fibronectin type 3 domain-containing protein [Paraglaciecola sp.]|jgi:fibronectin type 3 domain-containing protein